MTVKSLRWLCNNTLSHFCLLACSFLKNINTTKINPTHFSRTKNLLYTLMLKSLRFFFLLLNRNCDESAPRKCKTFCYAVRTFSQMREIAIENAIINVKSNHFVMHFDHFTDKFKWKIAQIVYFSHLFYSIYAVAILRFSDSLMTKEEKKNLTTDMDDTVQYVYIFRIVSNTFEQLSNAQFRCLNSLSLSFAICTLRTEYRLILIFALNSWPR